MTGRFNEFAGELTIDPASKTLVTGGQGVIQAKSIDTGIKQRDDHLRSPEFFDVEKFPTITFTGTEVVLESGKPVFVGKFTMHGVTKDIRVPVTVKGPITDPWGKSRIAFAAATTLNRLDYGVAYNKVLEAGGLMVGNEVTITIKAEAVKQQ